MGFEANLSALETGLPEPPRPLGSYALTSRAGRLVFMSGMLPVSGGVPVFTGRLEKEGGRAATELATLNALAVLRENFNTLDNIERVVRVAVYIASDLSFTEHAYVADGCSQLLNKVFAGSEPHARLVFGVSSLPKNAAVEIELIFELIAQVEEKQNN